MLLHKLCYNFHRRMCQWCRFRRVLRILKKGEPIVNDEVLTVFPVKTPSQIITLQSNLPVKSSRGVQPPGDLKGSLGMESPTTTNVPKSPPPLPTTTTTTTITIAATTATTTTTTTSITTLRTKIVPSQPSTPPMTCQQSQQSQSPQWPCF